MAKKKTAETTIEPYHAVAVILGKRYEAEGASIKEAIDNLKPGAVKGRAILTLKRGERLKERIIMPNAATRLFNTKGITHDILLKNTAFLFQGFDV